MSPSSPDDPPSDFLSVAIVGNDALVEALPARPIQFAHACRAIGFDVVLPGSWGDELVAVATLRALDTREHAPAVFCACPHVRDRLLSGGAELGSLLIAPVAPPVAAARYAREAYSGRSLHVTYIGDCPAASASEFDARHQTNEFLALLGSRGIDPLEQPAVFDAILPPDRRRYLSLPGGCPSPEALWQRADKRVLIELEGADLIMDLAQHLVTRQPVLVDLAAALGCACCGVTGMTLGRTARVAVTSLEPPGSATPVIDPDLLRPSDLLVQEDPPSAAVSQYRVSDRDPAVRLNSEAGVGQQAGGTWIRHNPRHRPIAITPVEALHTELTGPVSRHTHGSGSLAESTAQDVGLHADLAVTGRGTAPPPVSDTPLPAGERAFSVHVEARDSAARSVPGPIESSPPVDQLLATPSGGRREPAVVRSIRGREGSMLRISTTGFPTVRRADPFVSRLPRAYMRRRPGSAQHHVGLSQPALETAPPRESPALGGDDREISRVAAVEPSAPAVSTSPSEPASSGHPEAWINGTGHATARPTRDRTVHMRATGQVVDPLSGAQARLRARLSARASRETVRAERPAVWKTLVLVAGALVLIWLIGTLWEVLG
jgi:hypothetical protein